MRLFHCLLAVGLLYIDPVSGASQHAARPLVGTKQGSYLTLQSPVRWANMSMQFQQFSRRDLFGRQTTCNAGYCELKIQGRPSFTKVLFPYLKNKAHCCLALCPDGVYCCPVGETCTPDGCCNAGEQQCGSSHCYDPTTHKCCDNGGSCPLEDSCCEYECCLSSGYCGDDGFCETNTCTATSTSRTTSYYIFTTTITKVVEAEEQESASEFVCPPLTATNDANATLELGDDCSLTFYPPPTDASSTSSPFSSAPSLKPRAQAVDCLITSTSIVQYTVHTQTTSTTTVTETTIPVDFSCIPMTVTNVVGDELTLDEECKMEFSPGSSDSSPSSTSSATERNSTGISGGGSAASGGARSVSCYGMLLGLPFLFATYAYGA